MTRYKVHYNVSYSDTLELTAFNRASAESIARDKLPQHAMITFIEEKHD